MLLFLAACTTSTPPAVTLPVALPVATHAESRSASSFAYPVAGPDADLEAVLTDACERGDQSRYVRPLTLEIGLDGIAVVGESVLPLKKGMREDTTSLLLPPVFDALSGHVKLIKQIQAACPGNATPWRPDLLVVVDRRVPYDTVSAAIYSAGQAQFSEFWFLVDDAEPERRSGDPSRSPGSGSVVRALRSLRTGGPVMELAGETARLDGLGIDVMVQVDDWVPLTSTLARVSGLVTDAAPVVKAGGQVPVDRLIQAMDQLAPWFGGMVWLARSDDPAVGTVRDERSEVRGQVLDGTIAVLRGGLPKIGGVDPQSPNTNADRWPVMSGPDTIEVGQSFPLVVQLADLQRQDVVALGRALKAGELGDGEVGVIEGAGEGGALAVPLPNEGSALVDVVLSAPGFDVPVLEQTMQLYPSGDSTPARFSLTLREPTPNGAPAVEAWLFFHDPMPGSSGFARIARRFRVAGEPLGGLGTVPSGPVVDPERRETVADVLIVLVTDKRFGEDVAQVIVKTRGQEAIAVDFVDLPPGREAWVRTRLQSAGVTRGLDRKGAGAMPATLDGLGDEIWAKLVPKPVREALCNAQATLGTEWESVQLYTNETVIPWELARMRCGEEPGEFLGVAARFARWHVTQGFDATLPDPPSSLPVAQLTAIAPEYPANQALPSQAAELEALGQWPGFRRIGGAFDDVASLLKSGPRGIVHFAGHGTIAPGDVPRYALELEDGPMAPQAWRGLAPVLRTHPLVFFNACDIGRTDAVAGFVDGWAPAVLETGASGYIGGLWPLDDAGAAAFASRFYEVLDERIKAQRTVAVADVLRDVRAEVKSNGDPTFLAYAFYGDANLRVGR
ncbi:MAG: CHAT domain-containing protein [Myxococcota bacterium]